MNNAIEKYLQQKGRSANAVMLNSVQFREKADAARAQSLIKREALGMGKTVNPKLGMKPNARNEAKLANANERAAKQGLVKKR